MKRFASYIWICIGLSLTHCSDKSGSDPEKFEGTVIESEVQKFGIDTITDKLENPWGIAFLPDNRILVTERKGEIRIIENGKLLDEKIEGVPAVFAQGQGGLLDIKLHPDFSSNGWIYLTYSKPGEGGAATTLARTKLSGNAFTDFQELFSAQPYVNSDLHFGSRVVFDGKGNIFLSCGERGTKENAQTLENHLGKIIRLKEDGSVP
ncbi:MAG TPA: PQQ-dependent sugar dehydrogenase, partial [Ohtaekwangia sp.]